MVRAYQQLMKTFWAPVKRKEKKGKQSKQANKLNYRLLKISEVKIDKLEEDKEEDLFKTVLITNTMKHLHERRRQARENIYRTKSYASVTLPTSTPSSSSATTSSSENPSTFTPPPFPASGSSPRSLRRQCRQAAYKGLIYSKNAFEKIRKKKE